ncbi:MAG TPA: M81 family metallopeptidase [Acidothermaceae bacterium]|nr:M81 family metallopeptidase [Acidothermaceae bacterium]
MRFAIAGIHHESNTFAPSVTGAGAFVSQWGDDIRLAHEGAQSTIAGYLAECRANAVDAVPLVFAQATPSGTITADAFELMLGQLVDLLTADEWHGVLLALHGAAVSEDFPDADGEILRRVREAVGPTTPVVAALDMHANVSRAMLEASTALVTYRTNPHVDAAARAAEAAHIAIAAAQGFVQPMQSLVMIPIALNILRQNTSQEPLHSLLQRLDDVLTRPGILSASIAEGYPYADVPEMGMSVVVVADGDQDLASATADELAAHVWSRRGELDAVAVSVRAALVGLMDGKGGPVLLLDVGDNIGGGAPGDSVVILHEALRLGFAGLFMVLFAPDAVRVCEQAGPGVTVTLRMGAATDPSIGPPLTVDATVLSLNDGQFEDSTPTHGGQRYFDAGRTAVVELQGGITLALTSRAIIPASRVQMTSLGLDPSRFRAIVAKGVNSPLAGYSSIAAEVLVLDTPGCAAADLSRLRYQHRRVPMHPLDAVAE